MLPLRLQLTKSLHTWFLLCVSLLSGGGCSTFTLAGPVRVGNQQKKFVGHL